MNPLFTKQLERSELHVFARLISLALSEPKDSRSPSNPRSPGLVLCSGGLEALARCLCGPTQVGCESSDRSVCSGTDPSQTWMEFFTGFQMRSTRCAISDSSTARQCEKKKKHIRNSSVFKHSLASMRDAHSRSSTPTAICLEIAQPRADSVDPGQAR